MKTCLVVDDSKVIRKVARHILETPNFTVSEASDGREALDHCLASTPDVVLLDWNMPVMSGMDFLRALGEASIARRPKIVFCTTENECLAAFGRNWGDWIHIGCYESNPICIGSNIQTRSAFALLSLLPRVTHCFNNKQCSFDYRDSFFNLPQTAQTLTPPGWTKFLNMWLSRAVNFLTRRRCSTYDSQDHDGVHWHAEDNLIWWRDPRQSQGPDLSDAEDDVDKSDISMS